jgi:HSP20 family protein
MNWHASCNFFLVPARHVNVGSKKQPIASVGTALDRLVQRARRANIEGGSIMILTRWNPWSPNAWGQFNQLHNEVNRIFERYDSSRQEPAAFPPLNLWENENGFQLDAELPGVEMAELEITVTGPNQLTLKGQRKAVELKDSAAHRQERAFGSFVRTVTLPTAIDADNVEARLENGILKLTLPKHEMAKPRKIAIKS